MHGTDIDPAARGGPFQEVTGRAVLQLRDVLGSTAAAAVLASTVTFDTAITTSVSSLTSPSRRSQSEVRFRTPYAITARDSVNFELALLRAPGLRDALVALGTYLTGRGTGIPTASLVSDQDEGNTFVVFEVATGFASDDEKNRFDDEVADFLVTQPTIRPFVGMIGIWQQ